MELSRIRLGVSGAKLEDTTMAIRHSRSGWALSVLHPYRLQCVLPKCYMIHWSVPDLVSWRQLFSTPVIPGAVLQQHCFLPHFIILGPSRKPVSYGRRAVLEIILMSVNIRISAECLRRGHTVYTSCRWLGFASRIPLLFAIAMPSDRRSTGATLSRSPSPVTSSPVIAGQSLNLVAHKHFFRASTSQTVEAEPSVSETTPPPVQSQPVSPPQSPSGNNGPGRKPSRYNTQDTLWGGAGRSATHSGPSPPPYETAGTSEGMHAEFWPTYIKASREFDERRLGKSDRDLDILLVFVSLVVMGESMITDSDWTDPRSAVRLVVWYRYIIPHQVPGRLGAGLSTAVVPTTLPVHEGWRDRSTRPNHPHDTRWSCGCGEYPLVHQPHRQYRCHRLRHVLEMVAYGLRQ